MYIFNEGPKCTLYILLLPNIKDRRQSNPCGNDRNQRSSGRISSGKPAGSTHPHASSGPGSTPQRVSKRSYINSTTTSTLSRLSLSIESSQPTRHTSQPSQFTELRTNKAAMSASNPSPIPTTSASQSHAPQQSASSPTSASSSLSIGSERNYPPNPGPSSRPKVISRKSSGTNIIARDDPHIELQEGDETFGSDDARTMSPRRTSEGLEKMSQDSRRQLSQSVLPQLLS